MMRRDLLIAIVTAQTMIDKLKLEADGALIEIENSWIEEAIDSHEQWAERLAYSDETMTFKEPDGGIEYVMSVRTLRAIVGDVDHHKMWAARYREMLKRRENV